MALFILQPGIQPLGDFDALDTDAGNILGGEVMVLDEASRSVTSTEKAASDVFDGYVADEVTEATTRVVARIADEATETYDIFYLGDEGKSDYGVLFGTVVGSPTGLSTTGGTNLGPHTTSGSGKVTLWDKEGLYAISLDALSNDVVPTSTYWDGTGSQPIYYDTPLPGTVLYRETLTGKLARASGTSDKIAAFVELADSGTLVKTPARLVGATATYDRVKVQYFGSHHNA